MLPVGRAFRPPRIRRTQQILLVSGGEQRGEQLPAVVLVPGEGVVALGGEGGAELDAGLEEGAGLADGLERAVQLGGPGAPAVAEHPVVLAAQPGHLRPDRVGG